MSQNTFDGCQSALSRVGKILYHCGLVVAHCRVTLKMQVIKLVFN